MKTVKVVGGHVLTFDDITEQLLDQRRAAWSDVARRIAHEIKNPLTPIQLAAERLQRRYGKRDRPAIRPTFERLTGTIVRQVGDLRRMVDEFSSFARMPKPSFAEESLGEIARQALFLHEVAHPDIGFTLDAPDPAPILVCDRRLLGQALTNVVKNGVEAIQQRREERKRRKAATDRDRDRDPRGGRARSRSRSPTPASACRPSAARMTEPYMTTRAKGTGLGLAIVKKIVEEHFGQIEFEDRAGGGSLVRMIFDRQTLAQLRRRRPRRPSEEHCRNRLKLWRWTFSSSTTSRTSGTSSRACSRTRASRPASPARAAEALQALADRRPSLLLLDVWLQGSKLDGLQLLEEVKRRDPTLPVLMISGHGNLDTAVAAIRQGAVDFIEKPFEAEPSRPPRLARHRDRAAQARERGAARSRSATRWS